MTESEIRKLLERQRTFFSTGKTLPVSFRLRQLEKLKGSSAACRRESDPCYIGTGWKKSLYR